MYKARILAIRLLCRVHVEDVCIFLVPDKAGWGTGNYPYHRQWGCDEGRESVCREEVMSMRAAKVSVIISSIFIEQFLFVKWLYPG